MLDLLLKFVPQIVFLLLIGLGLLGGLINDKRSKKTKIADTIYVGFILLLLLAGGFFRGFFGM